MAAKTGMETSIIYYLDTTSIIGFIYFLDLLLYFITLLTEKGPSEKTFT